MIPWSRVRFRLAAGLAPVAAALAVGSGCHARSRVSEMFTVCLPYDISTLDPHEKDTLVNNMMTANLYEPLVRADGEMKIEPCLAERWENPDPATWIFHLRPGVRFHDGRMLSSSDVVYSINRLLQSRELDISNYVQFVEGVEAIDPLTVRIRTIQPFAVLLNKLRLVAIVPSGSSAAGLRARPDGTGPYRFRGRGSPDVVEIARNDAYWGPRPDLPVVRFEFERSAAASTGELLSSRAQMIRCDSKMDAARIGGDRRFRIARRVSILTFFAGLNLVDRPDNPFRLPEVRRAVNLSIDRTLTAAKLPTEAIPASQFVPPFIFGFNPDISLPRADGAEARQLLAHAGFRNGFDVTLHARSTLEGTAREVARQLAEVGIRARLDLLSAARFYPPASRGEFNFLLSGFACATGDASDVLNDSFHSADARRLFGRNNYFGFSDPAVDAQIEESGRLPDVGARRRLLQQITAEVLKADFWIPLCVDRDTYAIAKEYSWKPRGDGFILAAEISMTRGDL